MKSKDYKLSSLKYKLRELKSKNKKFVIWKLNPDQLYFVNSIGYRTEPYLYRIPTRRYQNFERKNHHIIKTLHYERVNGNQYIVRHLQEQDLVLSSLLLYQSW